MLNKGKIIILGIAGIIILIIVLGVVGVIPIFKSEGGDPNYPSGAVTLNFWGVDKSSAFSDVVKAYTAEHKSVKINYSNFDSLDEYKRTLLNKLAESNGPDLFMVPSDWVEGYKGIMYPAPPALISANGLKAYYPDVVSKDFVRDGQVFASPLYMDSLVLLYNKDIFNANAVIFAPRTWDDFVDAVVKTKNLTNNDEVLRAGTALGTSNNVNYMADIISSIILQLGSDINKEDSLEVKLGDSAVNAIKFYTQFSNPISPYYTWNANQLNSNTEFASGNVAMIMGYKEDIQDIKERNPFLDMDIAELPQVNVSNPKTFASYMGLAVSKQVVQEKAYVAWDFIRYVTSNPQVNNMYLTKTNRLPALRVEIQKLIGTEDDVFGRSFLFASSWKRVDWSEIKKIFGNAVDEILSGKATPQESIKAIENKINSIK